MKIERTVGGLLIGGMEDRDVEVLIATTSIALILYKQRYGRLGPMPVTDAFRAALDALMDKRMLDEQRPNS